MKLYQMLPNASLGDLEVEMISLTLSATALFGVILTHLSILLIIKSALGHSSGV